VREAVVNILVDDIGLVQDEVALYQDGDATIRAHHCQIFRPVVQIDIDDLKIHTFFVQHDPAARAVRAGSG
jgi:hypothetical protein